jgi:hypothetical protein
MAEDIKYKWLNAVKSEHGPESATTRAVLMMLSTHMDSKGKNCFPSISLLSSETLLSKRVVGLHLEKAVKAGWITRESIKSSGQAWRRYIYTPVIPEGGYAESPALQDKVVTQGNQLNEKGAYPGAEGAYPNDKKVVTQGNTSISTSYSKSISPFVEDSKNDSFSNKGKNDSILLSELLLSLILERRPTFKKPSLSTWAKTVDLMLSKDNRTSEEIKAVIVWCQQDPFWRNNVLSMKKLREKFDQLCLKMEAGKGSSNGRKPEPFMEAGYYD